MTHTAFAMGPGEDLLTVTNFEGLRLREEYDFSAFTQVVTIDGNLNHQPIN